MFAEELKVEFLSRVSLILEMDDLSNAEKVSAIGKVFSEIEKKNKSLELKSFVPIVKVRRQPTAYNIFIKTKMTELSTKVVPSKERFKIASKLWKCAD